MVPLRIKERILNMEKIETLYSFPHPFPKPGSSSSEEDNEALFRVDEPTTHILDPDSKYFAGVSEEVLKILRKEKMQEAYQKVGCGFWIEFQID